MHEVGSRGLSCHMHYLSGRLVGLGRGQAVLFSIRNVLRYAPWPSVLLCSFLCCGCFQQGIAFVWASDLPALLLTCACPVLFVLCAVLCAG